MKSIVILENVIRDVHDKHDPQIDVKDVEKYYSSIKSRHILLHHLDEDELYTYIKEFIEKNN